MSNYYNYFCVDCDAQEDSGVDYQSLSSLQEMWKHREIVRLAYKSGAFECLTNPNCYLYPCEFMSLHLHHAVEIRTYDDAFPVSLDLPCGDKTGGLTCLLPKNHRPGHRYGCSEPGCCQFALVPAYHCKKHLPAGRLPDVELERHRWLVLRKRLKS